MLAACSGCGLFLLMITGTAALQLRRWMKIQLGPLVLLLKAGSPQDMSHQDLGTCFLGPIIGLLLEHASDCKSTEPEFLGAFAHQSLAIALMELSNAPPMAGHDCQGSEDMFIGDGTWKGHFWPGLVFTCWALWWAWQSFACYHRGKRDGSGYVSRAWWQGCWSLEPLLKILGPPIGVLVELRLDHDRFLCVPAL